MYKKRPLNKTLLKVNKSYQGETIEMKVNRIVNNKEPIKDGAPLIYQDRKDGVQAQYDIRTDRWDLALDAMSTVAKSHEAQRDHRIGERTYDTMTTEQQDTFNKKYPNNKHNLAKLQKLEKDSGAESTQGTDK